LAPSRSDCEEVSDEWRVNHSCNPTVGYQEFYSWLALRDIAAGEQITFDYATAWTEEMDDETMECLCHAQNCRKIIKSDDWRLLEIQKRYRGYFTGAVQKKIDELVRD